MTVKVTISVTADVVCGQKIIPEPITFNTSTYEAKRTFRYCYVVRFIVQEFQIVIIKNTGISLRKEVKNLY